MNNINKKIFCLFMLVFPMIAQACGWEDRSENYVPLVQSENRLVFSGARPSEYNGFDATEMRIQHEAGILICKFEGKLTTEEAFTNLNTEFLSEFFRNQERREPLPISQILSLYEYTNPLPVGRFSSLYRRGSHWGINPIFKKRTYFHLESIYSIDFAPSVINKQEVASRLTVNYVDPYIENDSYVTELIIKHELGLLRIQFWGVVSMEEAIANIDTTYILSVFEGEPSYHRTWRSGEVLKVHYRSSADFVSTPYVNSSGIISENQISPCRAMKSAEIYFFKITTPPETRPGQGLVNTVHNRVRYE